MQTTAIDYITNWVNYMYIIIPAGAAVMVTYQAFKKSIALNDDAIYSANSKIRKTIIGAIIALSISGLITIIKTYF